MRYSGAIEGVLAKRIFVHREIFRGISRSDGQADIRPSKDKATTLLGVRGGNSLGVSPWDVGLTQRLFVAQALYREVNADCMS